MSKKSKSVSPFVDVKELSKHRSLMQDFEELHQEVDAMRGQLMSANRKKSILAAEVRFLRKRRQQLMATDKMNSTEECLVDTRIRVKQTNNTLEQQKPKKKQMNGAVAATATHARKRVSYDENAKPFIDKERTLIANDAHSKNSVVAFDRNQDSRPSIVEASIRRHPIFDLNEVSTGDEDFHINEESKRSLMRAINDEQQNNLKLMICRNAGEVSTRVGKRKISWQDPVALRV